MDSYLKLYWDEIIAAAAEQPERSIRIDGVHYWLYQKSTDGTASLPFYGHEFSVHRKDSDTIEIVMLWLNAPIPEEYKSLLPDNAEFTK